MNFIEGKLYRVKKAVSQASVPPWMLRGDILILLRASPDPGPGIGDFIRFEFLRGDQITKFTWRGDWISDWLEGPL